MDENESVDSDRDGRILEDDEESNDESEGSWEYPALPTTPLTGFNRIVRAGRAAVEHLLGATDSHVDAVDWGGATLLHFAAQERDIQVVVLLLELGASVNVVDILGRTPLHHAAQEGAISYIRLLLDHGANINAMDNEGRTPLYYVAKGGKGGDRTVELLLEHGASVNIRAKNGETPLHSIMAAIEPRTTTRSIRLLLGHGADANAVMAGGQTPLHRAAHEAEATEAAEALLDNGANNRVNIDAATSNGMTSLHLVAQRGKTRFVQLLLERGADIAATTESGMTALHEAAAGGYLEVVQCLVEFLHNREGEANTEAAQGHHAVDMIDATTDRGITALHLAAEGGRLEVVQFLCSHGANVNAIAAGGVTPLHLAAKTPFFDVGNMERKNLVRFLVEQSFGKGCVYALPSGVPQGAAPPQNEEAAAQEDE